MSTTVGALQKKKASHTIEVKQQLYSVINKYLDKEEFSFITIRNITSQVGITPSSFYNSYKSFENFLYEFLINEFYSYAKENKEIKKLKGTEKIIRMYILVGKFAEDKGCKYIQFFQQLYCKTVSIFNYRELDNPTVDEIKQEQDIAYHEAVCLNEIPERYESKVIYRYLDLIVSSNIFNWCNSDGQINLLELINLFVNDFLLFELTDDRYKKLSKIIGF